MTALSRWTATTSPKVTQVCIGRPSLVLSWTISTSLHSITAGLSPTRGTLTLDDGTGVRPAVSNSLTSGGTWAEEIFICLAKGIVAKFQTNSPVSRTLRTVSFQLFEEKARIGGDAGTALK